MQVAKKASVAFTTVVLTPPFKGGSATTCMPPKKTHGADQAELRYKDASMSAFYSMYSPLNSTGRRVMDMAERNALLSLAKTEQFVSPLWLSDTYLSSGEASSLRDHLSLGSILQQSRGGGPTSHYNSQQLSDHGSGLLSFGSDAHCLAVVMNSLRCAITGQPLITAYGADAAAAVARVAINKVLPFLVANPQEVPFKASIHHPSSTAWLYWAPETMMLVRYGGSGARSADEEGGYADFVLRNPSPAHATGQHQTPSPQSDGTVSTRNGYATHPFLTRCFTDASLLLPVDLTTATNTTSSSSSSPNAALPPTTSPKSQQQYAVRFVCAGATHIGHACHPLAFQYKFAKNTTYHQRQTICTQWNATSASPSEWIGVPMSPVLVTDCLRKFLSETGAPNKRKHTNNMKKSGGEHNAANIALVSISAAQRWCAATYHPTHYADKQVAMACTTTSYLQGVGNGAVSLWALFGTKKQFETLGSPVVAPPASITPSSSSSMTTVSLSSAIAGSLRSPVEEPVQYLDANGGASSLYCAAATAQPNRLLYLLKNRY